MAGTWLSMTHVSKNSRTVWRCSVFGVFLGWNETCDTLLFLAGKRGVFLVNRVNRQSQFVERNNRKKGHHSASSMIYRLFLNELFNNRICSCNTL